jgi:hypothetical protein
MAVMLLQTLVLVVAVRQEMLEVRLAVMAVLAVLASSSFVTPHLYYHPLPQQEALR